jgi:hypothetical protein
MNNLMEGTRRAQSCLSRASEDMPRNGTDFTFLLHRYSGDNRQYLSACLVDSCERVGVTGKLTESGLACEGPCEGVRSRTSPEYPKPNN